MKLILLKQSMQFLVAKLIGQFIVTYIHSYLQKFKVYAIAGNMIV